MRKSNEKASLDKNTEHNHRATLFGLPTEILLKIFRYVPGADAARAGRACKASYAIARTSPLKEKIQLERAQTVQVSTAQQSTFILRNFPGSFVVLAVGNNDYGRLGTGDTGHLKTFTRIRLPERFNKVIQIISGIAHTVAYGTDAEGNSLIATCGLNYLAQLGNDRKDSNVFSLIQLPPDFTKIFRVIAAKSSTIVCGMDAMGKPLFAATGSNNEGQLGINSEAILKNLTQAKLPDRFAKVIHISAAQDHTLISGLDDDDGPLLAAIGHNHDGRLGTGDNEERSFFTLVELPQEFVSISQVIAGLSSSFVCGTGIDEGPLLAVSGFNYGNLGTGDRENKNRFTLVKLPEKFHRFGQVIVVGRQTAVFGADLNGGPLLAVSFPDSYNQFGAGDSRDISVFTLVKLPSSFAHLDHIVVGNGFTVISGTNLEGEPLLAASGSNHYGQLGTGDEKERSTFTLVALPRGFAKVIQVVAGEGHVIVYGINTEGDFLLAVSGKNGFGQLGTGDCQNRTTFTLVSLVGYLQPLIHVLPENEKEQHDSDASEESFARHKF